MVSEDGCLFVVYTAFNSCRPRQVHDQTMVNPSFQESGLRDILSSTRMLTSSLGIKSVAESWRGVSHGEQGWLLALLSMHGAHKLKHSKFYLNITSMFFTLRVMEHWKQLPRLVVMSSSLGILDNSVDAFP